MPLRPYFPLIRSARAVLGRRGAKRWLRTPMALLYDRSPWECARDDWIGHELVLTILSGMSHSPGSLFVEEYP